MHAFILKFYLVKFGAIQASFISTLILPIEDNDISFLARVTVGVTAATVTGIAKRGTPWRTKKLAKKGLAVYRKPHFIQYHF